MAEALSQSVENLSVEDKKLQDIFLDGWNVYEELEETQLASNSSTFQEKVKLGMQFFEQATRIVSQLGMFSANELIDEVSTESLQYMLLPLFLGKLALKLQTDDRLNVLRVAEVYFNDYLQRCAEYDLCDSTNSNKTLATTENSGNNPELADLMRSAHSRNNKIAQYKRKKELEEQVKKLKVAVKSNAVDDEVKREFFLNFLKLGIIDAQEELSSLQLEKQMVEMHKARGEQMKPLPGTEDNTRWDQQEQHQEQPSGSHGHGHSHSHSHAGHSHTHHMRMPPPKPKPLQPFIITRDATQKAVFGMGYPSLPVMSVDDFYKQRVQEGIFPDEEKVAKMNQAQAIAALQNENEKEDQERAVVEEQIENDDEEYLARMRRMDEYKDVVRRGDGNRHNRS